MTARKVNNVRKEDVGKLERGIWLTETERIGLDFLLSGVASDTEKAIEILLYF